MTRQTDTSPDPVERYARRVMDGEVVAGPLVRLACKRHWTIWSGAGAWPELGQIGG